MKKIGQLMAFYVGTVSLLFGVQSVTAAPVVQSPPNYKFKKMMIVIFENTDYQGALDQPFFAKLARDGVLFPSFFAETHPSQGNYIALVTGDTYGVFHDFPVNLDAKHIGDLIEEKGKSWKIYLEDYPGDCFMGSSSGKYVRKHNPFISMKNIQQNSTRCTSHLVNAMALQADIQSGNLPDFSIYVPNMDHDGHDTGVAYADRWFSSTFSPLIQDRHFIQDLLLITTFDERESAGKNQIYTAFYGDSVLPGARFVNRADHYSLLRLAEDALGLGGLGKKDAQAALITGIWK